MNENEKVSMRMACIMEASKLKQSPITTQDYKDKTVVEIAKELEVFIFSGGK